jgi:hypothetical protein
MTKELEDAVQVQRLNQQKWAQLQDKLHGIEATYNLMQGFFDPVGLLKIAVRRLDTTPEIALEGLLFVKGSHLVDLILFGHDET